MKKRVQCYLSPLVKLRRFTKGESCSRAEGSTHTRGGHEVNSSKLKEGQEVNAVPCIQWVVGRPLSGWWTTIRGGIHWHSDWFLGFLGEAPGSNLSPAAVAATLEGEEHWKEALEQAWSSWEWPSPATDSSNKFPFLSFSFLSFSFSPSVCLWRMLCIL